MNLVAVAITSPGEPDYGRGLLEILRGAQPELGFGQLIHVHGLSKASWPGPYIADKEVSLPTRGGEQGRSDRLNAAVGAAVESGADYGLFIESDLWPLRQRLIAVYIRRMLTQTQLISGAAMHSSGKYEVPQGGIWPRLLLIDLSWQRAKRMFPLNWNGYSEAVSLRYADQWMTPLLSGCISSSFFQSVTEGAPVEAAKEIALNSLLRIEEFEPISPGGKEQWIWHTTGALRDPRAHIRADIVKRLKAEGYGPTLRRLAETGGHGWFNTEHAHPETANLLASS